MMDAVNNTHPIQLAAIAIVATFDVLCLIALNRHKKSCSTQPQLPWETRRNAYWILIASLVITACLLDVYYPIDATFMMPIKSYVFAFPLGLLDLYFSNTRGVPLKVLAGASLWCSTVILRGLASNAYYGTPLQSIIVTELSFGSIKNEVVRYVFALLGTGLLSDLLFSPMHRLTHHPKLYKNHHEEHHEYTNQLTSLVIYHGALLDDFLMPFTTTIGGFLYVLLCGTFNMQSQAFSNVVGYLLVHNTLLSHAHDLRCARLLAPLPDSVNFVAYHYVHHISPGNNFGLTEPSDWLWDKILGVDTIRKMDGKYFGECNGTTLSKKAL